VPPCPVELSAWLSKKGAAAAAPKGVDAGRRRRGRALAAPARPLSLSVLVDWGDGSTSSHTCTVDAAADGQQTCGAPHAYPSNLTAEAFKPMASLKLVSSLGARLSCRRSKCHLQLLTGRKGTIGCHFSPQAGAGGQAALSRRDQAFNSRPTTYMTFVGAPCVLQPW
jgi:hypothetical protein